MTKAPALKIYTYRDHSTRPSRLARVRANSMKEVSEIVGKPLNHIKDHLSALDEREAKKFAHLKHGEIEYEAPHVAPTGMSLLDLDRIASLGYIKSAKLSLHQCDLRDEEFKKRLGNIIEQIEELRADVSDSLEAKYKGR